MKQTRLDALADGIFAIVMTILVFEIRVPHFVGEVNEWVFINSLISMYPLFLSYLLSFSLLFTYWRSHHMIASVLAKNIDTKFSNYNGLFFFLIALVPFSSNFLGMYLSSETAVIFFAINTIFIGLTLYFMRRYAIKSEHIEIASFTERENGYANLHILFPVISSFFAIIISFYSNNIAILLLTLAILFNLTPKGTRIIYFFIDLIKGKDSTKSSLELHQ
ncbi:TPA: DUF1211 domain-containing protein [Candidatus Nomurabacteria bacterium]|nr:MAG: hypothetical protein O210_OD1C00001G0084 [Parcubacteria bacterium RAAC4_OD1_1]HCY26710.1 DUF1211 domain-containing protein [Candidatus Nomurabacteria bacterium]